MFYIIKDYSIKGQPHKVKSEIIDYGVKMIGAPLEWSETGGEGIKVGIIDTGIDLQHEDLQGRVEEYYNFTSGDPKDIRDGNGHGTHVAGIIAANKNNLGVVGVAPKCKLYIAKAFASDGTADNGNIIKALQWMLNKKVAVINMSFTTKDYLKDFEYMIKQCYSQGIVSICAAGNSGSGTDTIEYPAKYPQTIAVTAIDMNKDITDFSSTGQEANIAAPGKDILSTYPNSMYVTLSGTSMAAPLITGSVAILQAKAVRRFNRLLTPSEVKLVLDVYTEDLSHKGKDDKYGYGLFSFGRIMGSDQISNTTGFSNPVPFNTNAAGSYEIKRNPIQNKNSQWFYNTLFLKLMGFNL